MNLEMLDFEPGDYRVMLFNVQGQLLLTEKLNLSSGQHLMQLDLSPFNRGTYLIKLASEKGILVRRLIVD